MQLRSTLPRRALWSHTLALSSWLAVGGVYEGKRCPLWVIRDRGIPVERCPMSAPGPIPTGEQRLPTVLHTTAQWRCLRKRLTLSVVRSIWSRSATVANAPTAPQTVARIKCSTLNATKILPRAITRRQASHAPQNFSMAGRTSPPVRKLSFASLPRFRVGIQSPSVIRCCFSAGVDVQYLPRNSNHYRADGYQFWVTPG